MNLALLNVTFTAEYTTSIWLGWVMKWKHDENIRLLYIFNCGFLLRTFENSKYSFRISKNPFHLNSLLYYNSSIYLLVWDVRWYYSSIVSLSVNQSVSLYNCICLKLFHSMIFSLYFHVLVCQVLFKLYNVLGVFIN